jgi:hypothetical protein
MTTMAALLSKNDVNGKPIAYSDLPANEVLKCPVRFCEVSFTLSYGYAENRMEGNQNVLDVILSTAREKVESSHPHSLLGDDEPYIWGGIERGWLDKEQAKAAGI